MEIQKIKLDKKNLKNISKKFGKRTKEIQCPELNPLNSLALISDQPKIVKEIAELELKSKSSKGKDKKEIEEQIEEKKNSLGVVTITVQQLELSQLLLLQNEINDSIVNLVEGIVAAAVEKGKVESIVGDLLDKSNKLSKEAKYKLLFVQAGIVEPEMSYTDILWISQLFPSIILRLYKEIENLTAQGGTLKKST